MELNNQSSPALVRVHFIIPQLRGPTRVVNANMAVSMWNEKEVVFKSSQNHAIRMNLTTLKKALEEMEGTENTGTGRGFKVGETINEKLEKKARKKDEEGRLRRARFERVINEWWKLTEEEERWWVEYGKREGRTGFNQFAMINIDVECSTAQIREELDKN